MKVVLFCGGLGTRLKNHAEGLPKPLVPIGSRPILWYLMKYYAHFGHKDFILCLGYQAEKIKEYFLKYCEYTANDFTLSNGTRTLELVKGDIHDWRITFVDTGLKSNVGQRLKKVQRYLGEDEMFLANYADGLTDMNLNEMIERFRQSQKVAAFVCAPPSQSFHVVKLEREGVVTDIQYVRDSGLLINGGFFVFRRSIIEHIRDGEDLVIEPFQRLMRQNLLLGQRVERFWCMDTFKEQQELTDMVNEGVAPWEVWRTP